MRELKGDDSYPTLVNKMRKSGIRVTTAGLHKWVTGGGITAENLMAVAKFFNVSPSMLYFGEDGAPKAAKSQDAQMIAFAWQFIPERFKTQYRVDILKLGLAYAPAKGDNEAMVKRLEQEVKAL
jgi:hypothetical protein